MDCQFIKELVENESKINNIGIKSRKRQFTNYRFVYFALCREFSPKTSLEKVAAEVGLTNHTSVINGLKKFDDLKDTPYFKVYNKCFVSLSFGLENDDYQRFKNVRDSINYYRIRHILTTAKYHEVINKLQNKILILNKNR